jgi:ketosteroid isomerase-like protein
MRHSSRIYSTLLLCLTMLTTNVTAQKNSHADQVSKAVEELRKAMISADEVALNKLTGDKLSYGHSSGKVENKESFIKTLVSGESDFVEITLSDQTIEVVGDMAMVRHKLSANTNDKGRGPSTVNIGVLLIWYKFGKDWKLVGRQAFKL